MSTLRVPSDHHHHRPHSSSHHSHGHRRSENAEAHDLLNGSYAYAHSTGDDGGTSTGGGQSSAVGSASGSDARLRMLLNEIDESHHADNAPTHRRHRSTQPKQRRSHLPTPASGAAPALTPQSVQGAASAAATMRTASSAAPRTTAAAAAAPPAHRLPASLEDASAYATSVTQTVLDLRAQLELKDERVNGLEARLQETANELVSVREDAARLDDLAALEEDVEECNKTINRHLTFIDRLIKDKTELRDRCEDLVDKLKATETKYAARFKTVQDGREVELKRQKDMIAAAEKLRREKWVKEQTRKIKEMTIKGLEPEILRMVQDHEAQLARVREEASHHVARQDGATQDVHAQEMRELRQQCEADKIEAVKQAEEALRSRFKEQTEAEEKIFQDQRRKMMAQLEADREQVRKTLVEERKQLEADLKSARESEEKSTAALRADTEVALREQAKRHEKELRELREQLTIEKESWEEMYMRKQEAVLKEKEESIRDQLRIERDRQIDGVIEKLEDESAKTVRENEAQLETRVRRVKDKFDAQLRDAEQSEQACIAKYNAARQRLVESNEECASLRGAMAQRDRDLAAEREIASRLTAERDRVSDIVRVEFSDKLASAEAENVQIHKELEEARASHRDATANLQNEKERTLDELHEKVSLAISKKDETIRTLKEQVDAASLRADHLEELLTTQREQVLGR